MINPYAPPQNAKPETRVSASVTVLSIALVTLWGIFTGVFCFVGQLMSMSSAVRDCFGFGGMGLCLVGLPVIAALTIGPTQDRSSLRACCILDLLGILVFVAAVSMQLTRSFSPFHWFLCAAMACAAVVISVLIAFPWFNDDFVTRRACLLPDEFELSAVDRVAT